MRYSPLCLDYFYQRKHVGTLQGEDILTAEVSSQTDNKYFTLYIKAENNVIQQAAFQATAGVTMIAAAEYLCEHIENQPINEALKITPEMILAVLELPKTKLHAVAMVVRALQKVLG